MPRAHWLPSLLIVLSSSCGGGDSGNADASASFDGPPSTSSDGAAATADGSTLDAAPADASSTADGAATDTAPASSGMDMGMAGVGDPPPTTGDLYCMTGPAASDDVAYYYGYSQFCTIMRADAPPITDFQKSSASGVCAYGLGGKLVDSCPRDNLAATCGKNGVTVGVSGWRLIYKSSVTPDAEAVANDYLPTCGTAPVLDLVGTRLTRTCQGTVTLKVDGVVKTFDKNRVCTWKSNGTIAEYFIVADTATGDRINLDIKRQASAYSFGGAPLMPGVTYLEGGTKAYVVSADPAAAMLQVTKFEEKGAGLTATFSPGTLKSGTDARTLTEGTVDIQLVSP